MSMYEINWVGRYDMVIQRSNDEALRELALFAGAGGGILGGKLLGWRTVCAVERDAYAAAILAQRQNDGIIEPFPIWSDIETFDGRSWRGIVDIISGGFPCQDISCAGKGAGITGSRSGLWAEMARIISEIRPRYVYVENSPMLLSRGIDRVLGDLHALGYNAKWGIVSAEDVGAPHKRERIWIRAEMAYTSSSRCDNREYNREERYILYNKNRYAKKNESERESWKYRTCETCKSKKMAYTDMQHDKRRPKSQQPESNRWKTWNKLTRSSSDKIADTDSERQQERYIATVADKSRQHSRGNTSTWWDADPGDEIESRVGRMAHGVANGVDRLKAIGNGQVPLVAATAWDMLK